LSETYVPDFVVKESRIESSTMEKTEEDKDDSGLAFPLFGSVLNVKIEENETEIERRYRPDSYYFFNPSAALRREFELSSVRGEDIFNKAAVALPGMRMPWRVIDWNEEISKAKRENRKRSRPGKKLRKLRKERPLRHSVPGQREYGESRLYGAPKLRQDKKAFKGKWKKK
jgi:hypothetical protein